MITAAPSIRRARLVGARRARADRGARGAAAARGGEAGARRRRAGQRRRRGGARPRRDRVPRPRGTAMRRFVLWTAGFMAVIGLVAAYALTEEPDWYVRARYPLHYEHIVKSHAKNYDLDPAMVAAVIYAESKFDPATRSRAGAVGLMQLLPETAQGIADRTGGGALHRGRPGRSRHQRPLRLLVPAAPAREVPPHRRRDAARAGGVQRRAGERRPVGEGDAAGSAGGDPVSGDARLHPAGAAPARPLPAGLQPLIAQDAARSDSRLREAVP